jgi:peptidylprolyl isomerase
VDRRVIAIIGFAAALAVVIGAVLISRSGGDEKSSSSFDPADIQVSTNLDSKPKFDVPSSAPPSKLVSEDVVKGHGPAVKPGDTVTVQYVGVDYDTGKEFDSSWERPAPLKSNLGSGQVIPGWDKGVAGMKEGGRRLLVIPPSLAYGAAGKPPVIGPNATLVFVIDLESVG